MAKALLIIDAGADSIKAMAFSYPKFEPLAYSAVPYAPRHGLTGLNDPLSAIFLSIGEKVPHSSIEKVYVSIHPSYMSLRPVSVPFQERKKINEVLPFELSGVLPFEIEDAVIDSVPLGEGKALAVVLEKAAIRGCLDALKHSRVDPAWIGSAHLSIPHLLEELYRTGGVKAFVCRDFISVSKEGKPLFFNSFKGDSGLSLSLAYLDAEGIKADEVYYADWKEEELKPLVQEGTLRELELPGGLPSEGLFIFALAMQIKKGLLGETVNFRRGEFEYTKDKAAARKKLKTTAALVAAIIVIIFADIYLRYLGMSREYASYREALRASYTELFPAEKGSSSADELYQLNVKLKTLDKEAEVVKGDFSVLDIMDRISKVASSDPGMRIRLSELNMGDNKIKAGGEATSFEAANRFKDALSKERAFRNVKLSEVKAKTGGGAAFSLVINLK